MRILVVSARFPLPTYNGDSLVCLNRVRELSKRHHVTLACVASEAPSREALAVLEELAEVHVAIKPRALRAADAMAAFCFTGGSLQQAWFHSADLARRIARLHALAPFDIAHVVMLRALGMVRDLPIPRLIDVNDSQTLAVKHRQTRAGPPVRQVLGAEHRRIVRLEQSLGEGREHIVVLSDKDLAAFRPGVASVVPMGVEPAADRAKSASPTLMFSGGMSYYPNVEAALWLAERCWPRVHAAVPGARLRIVGRAPPAELLRLDGRDGVEVSGEVPSVADELAGAWVAAAPMTVSWGMHSKILQALSAGAPVVASAEAAEPFGRIPGLRIATSVDAFVAEFVRLLSDLEESRRMGSAGRSFVQARYSWAAAGQAIEGLYRDKLGVV